VVGLFVRDNRDSESIYSCLAELPGEFVPGRAAVNYHGWSAGRLEENRIALPDVEHLDSQAGSKRGCSSCTRPQES